MFVQEALKYSTGDPPSSRQLIPFTKPDQYGFRRRWEFEGGKTFPGRQVGGPRAAGASENHAEPRLVGRGKGLLGAGEDGLKDHRALR